MMKTVDFDPLAIVGDIIKVDGHNYRITKKAKTAIAVERYYWFDRLYDWVKEIGEKIVEYR
jgi:hypothetical protein